MPTEDGQITVLPNHAPIYTLVSAGEVIARTTDKGEISLGVGSGFANITQTGVTLLANFGILTDDIDEARAREAKERAETLLRERRTKQDEALAAMELSRSLLELKLANKRAR
jgi:F-type H+-transporting ATPase subunit epsilon